MGFGEVDSPGMTEPVPLSVCHHTDIYAGVTVSAGEFGQGCWYFCFGFFFLNPKLSHLCKYPLKTFKHIKCSISLILKKPSFGGLPPSG